jgi:hypothetical protein
VSTYLRYAVPGNSWPICTAGSASTRKITNTDAAGIADVWLGIGTTAKVGGGPHLMPGESLFVPPGEAINVYAPQLCRLTQFGGSVGVLPPYAAGDYTYIPETARALAVSGWSSADLALFPSAGDVWNGWDGAPQQLNAVSTGVPPANWVAGSGIDMGYLDLEGDWSSTSGNGQGVGGYCVPTHATAITYSGGSTVGDIATLTVASTSGWVPPSDGGIYLSIAASGGTAYLVGSWPGSGNVINPLSGQSTLSVVGPVGGYPFTDPTWTINLGASPAVVLSHCGLFADYSFALNWCNWKTSQNEVPIIYCGLTTGWPNNLNTYSQVLTELTAGSYTGIPPLFWVSEFGTDPSGIYGQTSAIADGVVCWQYGELDSPHGWISNLIASQLTITET